jgi:hypothetical protein
MRRSSSLLAISRLAIAVTAAAALSTVPVLAQQAPAPASPIAPITPMSVGMAVPDPALLVIPAPPGAKLRVEMDARSEDLLGMVKSFLKGIGETGEPAPTVPGQTPAPPNPLAQAISSGDLAAMLQDINHVHVAVYELAGPTPPLTMPAIPTPGKPGVKKTALMTFTPSPVAPVPAFDSNTFYENAFAAEGAHRIMFADADVYKLLMVGFPDKRGFAFAASGGGYVVIERSDGYPNLEVLTAFISHVTTAVLNSKTGKKMMDSTFNSPGDSGKAIDPMLKILPKK